MRDFITPGSRDRLVVAAVDQYHTRIAGFGAGQASEFEIGSLTKTMTGLLLSEAIERGEVSETTALGSLLDLDGSPAARISLLELATHHSGLPSVGGGARDLLGVFWRVVHRQDPYAGFDEDEVVMQARRASLRVRGFEYSNVGFALLGQALGRAAHSDWPSLMTERVFAPAGMTHTRIPVSRREVADAMRGWSTSGRPAQPWVLEGYAPAGAVRSTMGDMVCYARYLLSGGAVVDRTMKKAADVVDGTRIGYAWVIEPNGVIWHNGGTGGFSSILLLDRAHGRAVIVLSNTAVEVDSLGNRLMEGLWARK
ncbi:MAG: serine hydrolase domain-containing protein [Bifidobacterium sp.]